MCSPLLEIKCTLLIEDVCCVTSEFVQNCVCNVPFCLCRLLDYVLECVQKTGMTCAGSDLRDIQNALTFTLRLIGDNCEYNLARFSLGSFFDLGSNICSVRGYWSCDFTATDFCG